VTTIAVANVGAAIRDRSSRVDLAALSTELPYPDPASFLARLLGGDVPAAWLPATTRSAVARLNRLSGPARDRAAVLLARRLASDDIPVIPYGTPRIGQLLGPQLGCRRRDAFDAELDLTTLCLTKG